MFPAFDFGSRGEEVGVEAWSDGSRLGERFGSEFVTRSGLEAPRKEDGSSSVRDFDGDSVGFGVDFLDEPEPAGSGHVVDGLVELLLEGLKSSVRGFFFREAGFEVSFHRSVPGFGVSGLGRRRGDEGNES